ncbi:hypothetical protein RFI_13910 [Reticulomyxa filosa]|uniref:Uncharacterized protein n=1 Tax=Reticulomyxa filosa TaxID=46433 RepID=X6NB80_RETFI|nr:hypothetical protein RFI_13910 [Reticulomyxa filosa]|eukprot:ETO23271.1 hypothetical protein RFI_13910 [Reticulomyxa filosa]
MGPDDGKYNTIDTFDENEKLFFFFFFVFFIIINFYFVLIFVGLYLWDMATDGTTKKSKNKKKKKKSGKSPNKLTDSAGEANNNQATMIGSSGSSEENPVEGESLQLEASEQSGSYLGNAHNISKQLSQLQSHIRHIHAKPVTHVQLNHRSLEERFQLLIHLDGNFLREEILNSVTHGLGLLLSIVASIILMRESYYRSIRCMFASGIYAFTLCFMYFSSTMYHSFFSFVNLRIAFRILDYSSIFMLISGTYTPILLVALQHSPFHSLILLIVLWSVALMGVGYTAIVPPGKGNWKFFTTVFVGMSYGFVIALKSFVEVSQPGGNK